MQFYLFYIYNQSNNNNNNIYYNNFYYNTKNKNSGSYCCFNNYNFSGNNENGSSNVQLLNITCASQWLTLKYNYTKFLQSISFSNIFKSDETCY